MTGQEVPSRSPCWTRCPAGGRKWGGWGCQSGCLCSRKLLWAACMGAAGGRGGGLPIPPLQPVRLGGRGLCRYYMPCRQRL